MQSFVTFITEHQAWASVAGFWFISALISGMPEPTTESSVGYMWLYSSLHLVMANLNLVFGKKAGNLPLPQVNQVVLAPAIIGPAVPPTVSVEPEVVKTPEPEVEVRNGVV